MEQQTYNDPARLPEVQDIIMSGVIGCVSVEIAQALRLTPADALILFYGSDTCRKLHDKATGLYLYGDKYIADEFLAEHGAQRL